jgi:Flp pilus assembly protein TadD
MRRQSARVAAISSLATLLLGCASTAGPAPKVSANTPAPVAAKATGQAGTTPNAALPVSSTNLEDQIQAAVDLRIHGDTAKATHALAQLVLVAPDDPRVLGEYGKALVQQGRSDDAAAFLKRAIQLKPGDWTLYSALGIAYDQMDDRKNAKVAYDGALLLRPGDPTVLNNYAVSRMLAKDYDGAQRLLMQAQAAGGNLPKIVSNLQLLAQLRASKAPAATATRTTSTPLGTAKTNVPATASASAPSTIASRAPNPAGAAGAAFSATEAKSQPAVIVMQRIPTDTPQAAPQSLSRPGSMPTKASAAAKATSVERTAKGGPRTITPEGALKTDSRETASVVPKNGPIPAAANPMMQTENTKTSNAGKPVHPAAATSAALGRPSTHVTANIRPKPAKSIASVQPLKTAAAKSASGGSAKPAAIAQRDKAAPLPALRTADQGE